MTDAFAALLRDPAFLPVLAVVTVAGLVRGFSGFGSGLMISPAIAAAYGPQTAVAALSIIDAGPSLLLLRRLGGQIVWREVGPMALGYLLAMPLGLWALLHMPAGPLRWGIALATLLMLAALATGWRWHGARGRLVSLAVGLVSGLLGGALGVPGPPAILYMVASPEPAARVRASLIVYLLATDVLVIIGLLVTGLYTSERVALALAATPAYALALVIGAALFGLATEATYRRIALGIIAVIGLVSLPLLDPLLGR